MLYETEYPKVYSVSLPDLSILKQPIKWFKPYLTTLGQLLIYRMRMKQQEDNAAGVSMQKVIIRMRDRSEILIGITRPSGPVRAVVLYLHTICGTYKQCANGANLLREHGVAYITYTRSGNDPSLKFSKFNIVGRIDELQTVLKYIQSQFQDTPIHAVGASAGSALLIRYLGGFNKDKIIKSAVLVSPGYDFMKSCRAMGTMSKAYLVNKLKYMISNLNDAEASIDIKSIQTVDDWMMYQSQLLGYESSDAYIRDCDPVYYLRHINVPSLFISSLDDNIFSGAITSTFIDLPTINPNITIVTTNRGGHVMFTDVGYDTPWYLRVIHEWIIHKIKK